MASNFDPSTNEMNKSSQGSHSRKELNRSNSNSSNHPPSYRSLWKRVSSISSNKQINLYDSQSSYTEDSRNSSDQNTANSPPLFSIINQLSKGTTSGSVQPQVHIIEQKPKPYWDSGEGSFEEWNQEYPEGVTYGTEDGSVPIQEGYYSFEKPYKQKGLSHKIDRFVQRIPALGILYKQPSSSPDREEIYQQFKQDQMAKFSYNNQSLVHDSTPDDLSLKERYSNVTRSESINLQVKDETQPVDVSIHHETKKIYLCDVGRSVVEIYDMNKTFEHIINNSTMIKFRPTAIAITTNGTVIVASHFGHCLHMYSPNDSQNGTNSYSYKQFKLGTEGNQIHQFFQPAGIATDRSDGYLYVCDRGNCRIQVFTPDGICERIIELFLNYKKKYQLDPIRIAIQKNSDQLVCIVGAGDAICFVPKRTNGRIYVNPFFISDENELGLDNAAGLAVDDQDRIFISDTGHHRIVICTSDGNYITSFGTEGDGIGQLKRPCGLDITNDGTVIVTDPGNKRLQLFGVIQNKSSNEKSDDRSNLLINAEDISLTSL